jgi:predicted phage terminase large subunit-like protein
MKLTKSEYHLLLRRDLYAFTERCFYELNPTTKYLSKPYLEFVASTLEACRRGEVKRAIFNQPPRSMKSLCVSVAYVAFILGHDPSAKIICASYAQDLSNKHAIDCRRIMGSAWYQELFPYTRLSPERQAVQEFMTTRQGFRLSTSVGGVLTGRGADIIIIDDPLKPDDALSDSQRKLANDWFDHTLYSRLNDKRTGCIIVVMQRLHEDDLVGHILRQESWKLIRFPAIAEEDESHVFQTPYGTGRFERRAGEALHPEREPLEVLNHLRETQGEYNFSGQYQQSPAPLGGGMVKTNWFKVYAAKDRPRAFDLVLQSWDTANKPTELNDFSACTTWGVVGNQVYLLHVYRKRLGYPELKRAVREQAAVFGAKSILIEDRASGTQLIQELVYEGMHEIKKYEPKMDKTMRMHSVTATIENGFVHIPENADGIAEYLHEMATFPRGKYDDLADSTSQALDWIKNHLGKQTYGLLEYRKLVEARELADQRALSIPESRPCPNCNEVMSQRIPGGLKCMQCGAQWPPPSSQARVHGFNRNDILNSTRGNYWGRG